MGNVVVYSLLVKEDGEWVRVWDEYGTMVRGTNKEGVLAYALRQKYPDQYRIIEGVTDEPNDYKPVVQ